MLCERAIMFDFEQGRGAAMLEETYRRLYAVTSMESRPTSARPHHALTSQHLAATNAWLSPCSARQACGFCSCTSDVRDDSAEELCEEWCGLIKGALGGDSCVLCGEELVREWC